MESFVKSEPFLSLESKDGPMTTEEELEHYRQRFQSMKLVLKELQQQVGQYKTRCAGVDTVALMLKESRQEVMRLTKQRKALEIAVVNLQNRLSTNGLSNSLNIEETEQFLPGPSKQTLDNLARENGRLRSLLKSLEGQCGVKSPEELQSLKASLEILEAENNNLRAKLLEFEDVEQVITSQYEEVITKLKQEHESEKSKLEEELDQLNERKMSYSEYNESASDVGEKCKSIQSDGSINIDEIRRVLKLVSDHCLALDLNLENVHLSDHKENVSQAIDKAAVIAEEKNIELEKKLNQVVQMNQRWQAYNQSREQQVHGLLARITELEHLNKEGETLKNLMNAKELENQELKKEVDKLTRETNKMWSQPPFDVSIVEILKQQIQVCTEDFNTERKDREHAVTRGKLLQEELSKMTNENDALKKDLDNLRRIKNTPELEKQESSLWARSPQQKQYFLPRGVQAPLQRNPYTSSSGTPASSMSPAASSGPSLLSTSSMAERSSFHLPSQHDYSPGYQRPVPVGGNRLLASHRSQEGATGANTKNMVSNLSMPALSRKTEDQSRVKNRQADLTCPKCSKEFTEDQHSDVITHINICTD